MLTKSDNRRLFRVKFTQQQMNPDIHLVLVRQDHTQADVLDVYKGTKGGQEFRQFRFTQWIFRGNVHANQGVIETVGVQSLIAGHRFENVRQPSFQGKNSTSEREKELPGEDKYMIRFSRKAIFPKYSLRSF